MEGRKKGGRDQGKEGKEGKGKMEETVINCRKKLLNCTG